MAAKSTDSNKPSLYSSFNTDATLEKEGIWVDFGPAKICIKRAGGSNKAFQSALRANLKPYKYQIDKGFMDEEDDRYQEAFMDAFVNTVVIGWEGNIDGKKSAFTPALAKQVFTDLPEVFAEVLSQSTKVANFRRQEVEETAKK